MPIRLPPVLAITFPRPLPEMSSRDLLAIHGDLSQATALLDGGVLHHEVLAVLGEVFSEILRRLDPVAQVRCSSCGWTGACQECSTWTLSPARPSTHSADQIPLLGGAEVHEDQDTGDQDDAS